MQKIDESFLIKSYAWFQCKSLRKLTLTPKVTKKSQTEWFNSLANRSDYKVWGVKLSNEWIGAFGLKYIDFVAGRAEYWGYIGEPGARGIGIGKWMISRAVAFACDNKLHTLYLKVCSSNSVAQNLYAKMGFAIISQEKDILWMEKIINSVESDKP